MDHIILPAYRRSGPQHLNRTVVAPPVALHHSQHNNALLHMITSLRLAWQAVQRTLNAIHIRF